MRWKDCVLKELSKEEKVKKRVQWDKKAGNSLDCRTCAVCGVYAIKQSDDAVYSLENDSLWQFIFSDLEAKEFESFPKELRDSMHVVKIKKKINDEKTKEVYFYLAEKGLSKD